MIVLVSVPVVAKQASAVGVSEAWAVRELSCDQAAIDIASTAKSATIDHRKIRPCFKIDIPEAGLYILLVFLSTIKNLDSHKSYNFLLYHTPNTQK